eukprot:scaffold125753_cov53-Phaeocystis_antarctica.AAC.5
MPQASNPGRADTSRSVDTSRSHRTSRPQAGLLLLLTRASLALDSEAESQSVKEQIAKGELAFEEAAMQFSSCDSAARGGMLGKFGPGTMVKEFDAVVFGVGDSGDKPEYPCAEVIGPVRTKFGFHLIKIASRNMPKIGYKD